MTLRQAQNTTTGQTVTLAGWTLTLTADGVELIAPGGWKIDLFRLEMIGDNGLKVRKARK